jgi:hypothetical protein
MSNSHSIHDIIHNASLTEAHAKAHAIATVLANQEKHECPSVYISMYLKIYTQQFEKIYTQTCVSFLSHITQSE